MLSYYFEPAYYRDTYPDVADAQIDPLLHFIETGLVEERSPHPLVDLNYILSQDSGLLGSPPQIELLVDLLEYDLAIPSPYFDPAYYRASLGTDAPANALLRHFITQGMWARHQPNPWLDLFWYAENNPDVPHDPASALRHFIQAGDAEGRAASPAFDGRQYLLRNPDVAQAGMLPLRRKRKLVPTVDGVSFQAARSSTAPLQFQGRSSLSLEARCPRGNWSMA